MRGVVVALGLVALAFLATAVNAQAKVSVVAFEMSRCPVCPPLPPSSPIPRSLFLTSSLPFLATTVMPLRQLYHSWFSLQKFLYISPLSSLLHILSFHFSFTSPHLTLPFYFPLLFSVPFSFPSPFSLLFIFLYLMLAISPSIALHGNRTSMLQSCNNLDSQTSWISMSILLVCG